MGSNDIGVQDKKKKRFSFVVKYPFKQHFLVHCRLGPNTLTKSKPS